MKTLHKEKYKAAIIGVGRIGMLLESDPKRLKPATHFGMWQTHPRVELVAVCDNNPTNLETAKKRLPSLKLYSSAEKLFQEVKPDIVSIATWKDTHYEMMKLALDHGVPAIVCEKPIAEKYEHAKEVVDLAKRKGTHLFINHRRRFSPKMIFETLSVPLGRVWLEEFENIHGKLMCDMDAIFNATATNVDYYKRCGHKRSYFIGPTWKQSSQPVPECIAGGRYQKRPIKIIGHVGLLDQTGSTFGLRFLLEELMPALRKAMRDLCYEVHIIGGRKVVPYLQPLLKQEHIIVRGYVKDLNTELLSSDLFLFLNNAGEHLAAYSRHVVAWSMGLCLIVHSNSVKTIPQIKHMENALVGSSSEELAQLVYLAATDSQLNSKIRYGGRQTFEACFSPTVQVRRYIEEIEYILANKQINRPPRQY